MQAQIGNQWASALAQLADACSERAPAQALARLAGAPREEMVPRFNPRPAGVLRFGCGTHAVFELLCEDPAAVLSRSELIERTGLSRKAVDFAILCLQRVGAIDVVDLPSEMRVRRTHSGGSICLGQKMDGRPISGASAPRLGFRKGSNDPPISEWRLSRLSLQQRVANFMAPGEAEPAAAGGQPHEPLKEAHGNRSGS